MSSSTDDTPLSALDAETLGTRSRADFVYDSLRDAIWEGRFARGARVREEDVAKTLGVSRTPVREALQRLQQRGLLENRPGRGLTVAELSKRQVLELYAMREILEGSAARFAAEQASRADIEILDHLQRDLSQAPDEPLTLVKLNRRFHLAIYEAAHNDYLLQALDSLHDSMALLNSATFRAPNLRQESDAEHRGIVEAIARRDPDAAETLAREHIRRAQRTRFATLMADRD